MSMLRCAEPGLECTYQVYAAPHPSPLGSRKGRDIIYTEIEGSISKCLVRWTSRSPSQASALEDRTYWAEDWQGNAGVVVLRRAGGFEESGKGPID
jgi:hypothetical protein